MAPSIARQVLEGLHPDLAFLSMASTRALTLWSLFSLDSMTPRNAATVLRGRFLASPLLFSAFPSAFVCSDEPAGRTGDRREGENRLPKLMV